MNGHSIGDLLEAQLIAQEGCAEDSNDYNDNMSNVSKFSDKKTANTSLVCADTRASELWKLGVNNVLELCVGPSLSVLESFYKERNMECWGNDIDARWEKYYPKGKWIIGDAIEVFKNHYFKFDGIVFAPPLSIGCSGKREDSLKIFDINPSYIDFLETMKKVNFKGHVVFVLPGRALATKEDRNQFYKLLNMINANYGDVRRVDLIDGCRKYTDIHINAASQIG